MTDQCQPKFTNKYDDGDLVMRLLETEEFDIKKTRDFIGKNCQPYINANPVYAEELMLRGLFVSGEIQIHNGNVNRHPKDMPLEVQKVIDTALSNAGFKALRSNSIYCTGDYATAENYGNGIFVIYPIGDFSFTYAPHIKDLYESLMTLFRSGALRLPDSFLIDYEFIHNFMSWAVMRDFKFDGEMKLKDYLDTISQKSNLSLQNVTYKFYTALDKSDLIRYIHEDGMEIGNLDHFIKTNFRRNDLTTAIEEKCEILINCDKYLAVPVNKHYELWK